MIPFLLVGLAFLQVVIMGPIPIEKNQIISLKNRTTLSATDSFAQLAQNQVVLIGESHTDPGHHAVQLEVIRGLQTERPNLAIGLEMMPRHFQPQLDEWIKGGLSETDFLDAVEWYFTWGYEAELYLPIFRFAREQKIPLVALNLKREIVHQVRVKGVDDVEQSIKDQLPTVAPASSDYRIRLREVFDSHPMMSKMGHFDQFVQAQQVWDGVMAEQIVQWLKKNPDGLLVGLAGSGHIIHGHGIPHQLRVRQIEHIATLLPWTTGEEWVDSQSADYAWGVAPSDPTDPPVRLGVFLEESSEAVENSGPGVLIKKVIKESPAALGGLLADDRITHINGQETPSRHTLVRMTRSLRWGEAATLTIHRGEESRQIKVNLTR
ncbi:MAG: ChaN family lipoprotein [Magnetococcales bacterium]|nr:ChaN family lipoprotein [Magnetococcales bacterium]